VNDCLRSLWAAGVLIAAIQTLCGVPLVEQVAATEPGKETRPAIVKGISYLPALTAGKRSVPTPLTNHGWAVVGVGYRLHPKVRHPAYIEDAAAALAWTFKNIESYGGDPKKIFVTGISAGGYLTSMVGLDKAYLAKHGIDANQIAALIPVTGQMITHQTVRKEQGIEPSKFRPTIDPFAPL
jgi:hypothetical protein